MDNYKLVYDVSQELPPLWFPAGGLIFVAAGIGLWRTRKSRPDVRQTIAAIVIFPFSVLWTLGSLFLVVGSHCSAQQALANGTVRVVEGPVEQFALSPKVETFSVSGVVFRYSDGTVGPGFHRTGGPVHPGLFVRVHYMGQLDPEILKLEIRDSGR